MVKTVVVAVDGTPAATRAAEVGVALAASTGARVHFVHYSPLAEELFKKDPENGPSQEAIKEADAVLREAAEVARERGVTAELMVQDEPKGMIAADLAGLAEGVDAELVVVGNRGRGEVADVVLGSVSHELLRMSSAPVVVVHAGKQKDEA